MDGRATEPVGGGRRRGRVLLRVAVGCSVSAAALLLVAREASVQEIAAALDDVRWPWLLALAAARAAIVLVKGIRWHVILGPVAPDSRRGAVGAVAVGYLANLVLPIRVGEVLRVALLRRRNPGAPLGAALASVGAERLLDGLILAALVVAVLPFADAPSWLRRGTWALAAFMAGAAALAAFTPAHRAVLRRLPASRPGRWLVRAIEAASAGTAVLRQGRALAGAASLTGGAWALEALKLACGFAALGIPLGLPEALVLTLLYAWGLLVPSAPVQLGNHQALTILFLEPLGVTAARAVALSVVLQAVNLAVLGVAGALALARESARRPPA